MREADELIPTRHSLLDRLKDRSDQESWKVFFDTYWRLIYRTAIKSGLTDAEAQDVVQETVISVFKTIPEFETRTRKGSFKSWLLRLTGWRITDQLRKRQRQIEQPRRDARTSTKTAIIDRVADPAGPELEAVWDKEWEMNILEAAAELVKKKVDARQYQIFDLHVLQQWPASRVAHALKINRASVYLAKHRLNKLLKKEIARLRSAPDLNDAGILPSVNSLSKIPGVPVPQPDRRKTDSIPEIEPRPWPAMAEVRRAILKKLSRRLRRQRPSTCA